MGSRLASIRDRVRLLSAIDTTRKVFGAATHDYAFGPGITSTELADLEARFGALPDDYRAVIGELGATGAGPYYGLIVPTVPEASSEIAPDPMREFRCEEETGYEAPRDGEHVLDGTLVVAEQGCGGRSVLVIRGARRGEVWSDWTSEEGTVSPEAPDLLTWYEHWLDRAMLEWIEGAAPRIALEGPDDPSELEAVALAFELVERHAPQHQDMLRTLGYLHLREGRSEDASAAFAAAAAVEGCQEPTPRLHLDRARMHVVQDAYEAAVRDAEEGLAAPGVWASTRDELRAVLERALGAAGRRDEALAVLDDRAAASHFSFTLHHRLARERIARGDLAGAGAALERAADKGNIIPSSTREERIAASFDPIIAELRAARRESEARTLLALADRIRNAN